MNSSPGQPNWLGLLQWSLAYSDGTSSSTHTPMTEEDKLWLERVMKEAVKDEPARLNEIMMDVSVILTRGPTEADDEKLESSLEEVKSIVDQIDMAQIFVKFGGSKYLLDIMNCASISPDLKALAASVVGTVCQNNLIAQDILYKEDFLDKLLKLYAATDSAVFCTKLLYATSCLIRNHAALEETFVNSNWADVVLTKAFTTNHPPLILRAVFLCNALLSSDSTSNRRIEHLTDLLLPAVLVHLNTPNTDLHENVVSLLTTLLHTEYGWKSLTQTHAAAVQDALTLRMNFIQNSIVQTEEDDEAITNSTDPLRYVLTAEEVEYHTRTVMAFHQQLDGKLSIKYPAIVTSDSLSISSNDMQKLQIM